MTSQLEEKNLSSLEKGISLFFSLNFLRIFSRCPIVLLHWFGLYRFGTNSAPKWKLLDYPLRSTVSFTIWGIYLLIPSTWNNLDELNLLITHQTRRARPALTTEFIQHWIHPFFFYLCRLFTCSWPPLLWLSISDQSLLNSVLFSLPSLCWSVYGSEPWCCWRWISPSSGGCVWPRGCGCCPGWQSCVGPSSFVWGFTLRQSCSVGPR